MSTKDPYTVLGVARTASDDDIRKAYRRLAKECHPDLNPGDTAAETRFKEISQAYALLGDKDQRARYDRGEIDGSGQEKAAAGGGGHSWRHYANRGEGGAHKYWRTGRGGGQDFDDMDDIFSDLFGDKRGAAIPGGDKRYRLTVTFVEAANGVAKRVTMPDGQELEVKIPAGLQDGQVLRLKGKGKPGLNGGPAGNALITVTVAPHPHFTRDGNDIHLTLPVTLAEALTGGKVSTPTLTGRVTLTVPPHSNTGTRLRLKGKGINGADQYVTLAVHLPPVPDEALEKCVGQWEKSHPYTPRAGMEG